MRVHACSLTSIGGHPDDPRGHSFPRVPAPNPLASSHLTCTFWRSRREDPPTPDPPGDHAGKIRRRRTLDHVLVCANVSVSAAPFGSMTELSSPFRVQ